MFAHEGDHVGHALRAIAGELILQVERGEACGDIGFGHHLGGLVLHSGKNKRDDALGDRGIAVCEEMQRIAIPGDRIDPDAGRAAAHERGVGLQRIGHGFQLAAEIDQQPIAFVRVEEFIFFKDVVDLAHGART